MSDNPAIAVLIPCYNEAENIGKVVADFRDVLPGARIYVCDNNSTDGTAAVADAAGAIVFSEHRQGKGNVVRAMLNKVDADIYVIVDGDDTYDAADAPEMVDMLRRHNADMVVGDRLSSTYFSENKRPFHNSGNRLVRRMINSIFDADIHDILSGYRVLSREFVRNFPIMTRGFEIETEMTIHALDRNCFVLQKPVGYRDRKPGSTSKLNTFRDGFKVIRTILSLFRNYRPMQFFSILAGVTFLLSMVLFVPVLIEYWQTGLVPRFPTLIASCTLLMLAMLLLVCGLILSSISANHRQLCELLRKQRC